MQGEGERDGEEEGEREGELDPDRQSVNPEEGRSYRRRSPSDRIYKLYPTNFMYGFHCCVDTGDVLRAGAAGTPTLNAYCRI